VTPAPLIIDQATNGVIRHSPPSFFEKAPTLDDTAIAAPRPDKAEVASWAPDLAERTLLTVFSTHRVRGKVAISAPAEGSAEVETEETG
jgi:hypothetical protein